MQISCVGHVHFFFFVQISFALGSQRKPHFQWNIGGVGTPTQNLRVGHVHFMLFMSISFASGTQRKLVFQWNMGFTVFPIAECKQSPMGSDYRGTVSVTRNGLPCQAWTSQIPHAHNFMSHKMFPDTRVEDARNYCRNPESGMANTIGPWCFTSDPDVRYQFCDIPRCSGIYVICLGFICNLNLKSFLMIYIQILIFSVPFDQF